MLAHTREFLAITHPGSVGQEAAGEHSMEVSQGGLGGNHITALCQRDERDLVILQIEGMEWQVWFCFISPK